MSQRKKPGPIPRAPRFAVTVRIPMAYKEQFDAWIASKPGSRSDIVSDLVTQHLDHQKSQLNS